MPRKNGLALSASLGEQAVVLAPLPDLQQLPPEHLGQRLAGDLALDRIHALAERRAQPGMQIESGRFGHGARITDRGADEFKAARAAFEAGFQPLLMLAAQP